MYIRWTLPNGTYMWHRADMISSVQKDPETKLKTIVWMDRLGPRGMPIGYDAVEDQQSIIDATIVALKTGNPTIVEKAAEDVPPKRLISN